MADTSSTERTIAGWEAFVESLRSLPGRMLAKLPELERDDPQIQQEIGRLALQALTSSALASLGSDAAHPSFMPQLGQVLNVGQPNADTIYRIARIAPEGSYRLRGTLGSLRLFNISQSPPSPADPGFKPGVIGARPRHDFSTLKLDENGRFSVILSQVRPDGHAGDWWKLEPTTTMLLMRMVSADWLNEQDPVISIERLDLPVARPHPTAAELEFKLRNLPAAVDFIALLFVDHVEVLRAQGYVNKLKVFDVVEMGGLAGQAYYEGVYDLADDDALIVESTVPKLCAYRSLILTNYIYETTDWVNNQSSLNDAQAAPDSDGILRIVVSTKDPGVPNWLDTAGYRLGLIQGRWADCDSEPMPSVRKVALADLRKFLPADTATISPEARDKIVRERRAAAQQRPLW